MSNIRQTVIGYGRVSTEEQENNYSLDAQRSRFEALCKQNKWQSLGFFPETGSGTSVVNRPVLWNILQRIQQGGVDALWVKETDRLFRPENLGDLSMIAQTLESNNTLLMVDTRTMDLREDNSVLMLDFEGVLAKHFRRQLLRNMNRGKVRKAELGRKAGGQDIYGYRTNENGEYVPAPDQAKVVRLIFDLYARGLTLRRLGAELKRRGIRTPWGRENWSVAVLGALLKNDVYIGIYRFQKSQKGKDTDGSKYKVHAKEQIVVGSPEKPNHQQLTEPSVFYLVQRKLEANRKNSSCRLYMATGLLRCPVCSAHMHAKYSSASHKHNLTVVKYACSNKPECPSKRFLVSEMNDLLWQALVELFMEPERIHFLLARSTEENVETLNKELVAVEKEEKLTREKIGRLLNLYLEGHLTKATYGLKSSDLERENERLAERKSELVRQINAHGKQNSGTELIQTLRVLARSHRRFTEDQKVRVFRSLIKEARITAAGVELQIYAQPTENVWWKYRQKRIDSTQRPARPMNAETNRIHTSNQV